MTAQAAIAGPGDVIPQVAKAAYGPYEVHQLPNGGAGYISSGAGIILGQGMNMEMLGMAVLPKAAGIALLDGGRAYWNVAEQEVTYLQTSAGDFLLGSIVGDAQATDAECTVNFNVFPVYTFDLLRDPRTVAPVLTAGSPSFDLNRDGILLLDATNEAEKIDLLGVDGFATGSKGIIELAFALIAGDTDSTAAIVGGIAGATTGASGIPEEWIGGIWEWPRSVKWVRALAVRLANQFSTNGTAQKPQSLFWPGLIPRNLLFLSIVLLHGFRRLLPPY